jgi:phenylacetate-CoA ligase
MAVWQRIKGEAARRLAYPAAERLAGREVRAKLARLDAMWALPAAERRRQAAHALAEMVAWAGAAVPYYRDLFARHAFDPERLRHDPACLGELPCLTKEIIRAEGPRLLREDHPRLVKHCSRTGGSTGPAADIYYDQPAADWSSAVTRHARAAIGKHHALTELHLASRFPETFPLKDRLKEAAKCFAMNRANAFIADFEPASLDELWRRIKRLRPHLVHGHPSTLYHLARHVEARGEPSTAFAVFESSGELLEARQRETIAQVFGCRVVDRYGLAEFGVVAYQMDGDPAALRVYDGLVWPEVTAEGELVLTGLTNRMMPLIRYRTGDLAKLTVRDHGPVLSDLVGRVHDLVAIDGKTYPTHYIQDLLQRIGGVAEFQIVAGNQPVLRLVLEPGQSPDAIRARLAGWWGTAVDIEFIEPAALMLCGHRGKFRHVVSSDAPLGNPKPRSPT